MPRWVRAPFVRFPLALLLFAHSWVLLAHLPGALVVNAKRYTDILRSRRLYPKSKHSSKRTSTHTGMHPPPRNMKRGIGNGRSLAANWGHRLALRLSLQVKAGETASERRFQGAGSLRSLSASRSTAWTSSSPAIATSTAEMTRARCLRPKPQPN